MYDVCPNQNDAYFVLDGVQIRTVCASIKDAHRDDIVLFTFDMPYNFSGVYTLTECPAAPVIRCKNIDSISETTRGLVVNSGNANACTSSQGLDDIEYILEPLASHYKINTSDFLMCSTGVIGERLPVDNIRDALSKITQQSQSQTFHDAAKAIMTTDTYDKCIRKTFTINEQEFTLIAIAKGAGMIAPNMATMLSFIFTDFQIPRSMHRNILVQSVEKSFNLITVDGDTSTNDTVLLFSPPEKENTQYNAHDIETFTNTLDVVNKTLAKMIIMDAEGARKFIRVRVENAQSYEQAKKIALSIANSPLCKTAIAGEDANWGRIFMAIGKANAGIVHDKISLYIGDVLVAENGHVAPHYIETDLDTYMKNKEITLTVNLALGQHNIEVLTSDLNEQYIAINADYRS